jgi:predicted nuclease of predicted toxin-antitoxin system
MIRILTDQDFNEHITRGLLARYPDLDLVLARQVGLEAAPDPQVLEWAAQVGRIVFTHDIRTMKPTAIKRIEAGQPMPGIVVVLKAVDIGRAIDELLVMIGASFEGEWANQIRYISESNL